MRNIYDVIRQKETEVLEIQKELEALRLAARLLTDDDKPEVETPKMRMAAISGSGSLKADTEVLMSAPHRPFP